MLIFIIQDLQYMLKSKIYNLRLNYKFDLLLSNLHLSLIFSFQTFIFSLVFNSELCRFSFQFQNVPFEKKSIFKIVHFLDYISSHAVWKRGRSFLTNALSNEILSAVLFKNARLGYNFAGKRGHALEILNLNFDQKREKKKGEGP